MLRSLVGFLLLGPISLSPLAAVPAPSSAGYAPVEIKTTVLGDGVYQFTIVSDGYVQQLNSVAVVTRTDVLVFDTTTRPSTARRILDEIRRLTSKPVRYVVNSHWHPDHWSGNQAFADVNPNLEIISTEQERDFMLNTTSLWSRVMPEEANAEEDAFAKEVRTGQIAPGVPLTPERKTADELDLKRAHDMTDEQRKLRRVYPNLTFTDRMVLRHGGREFQFISVTGDAAGTTVMYLPKEKILVTGDTVSYPIPYYTPPLSVHAASIRQLAQLDADTVVPGHGPAFHDKRYMLLEADLFDEVLRQVRDILRGGGVSIDDVQKAVNFDAFKERFAHGDAELSSEFNAFTPGVVRKAYIELRDSKEIR